MYRTKQDTICSAKQDTMGQDPRHSKGQSEAMAFLEAAQASAKAVLSYDVVLSTRRTPQLELDHFIAALSWEGAVL